MKLEENSIIYETMSNPVHHRWTRFQRLLLFGGILIIFLANGIFIWKGLTKTEKRFLSPLPILFALPDFSLIERSGLPVGLADLRGKVWVANFIYAYCPDTCPLQSTKMAKLQKTFYGNLDLKLVSISIDPIRDTPEVLTRYAKLFGADPTKWLILTGEKTTIYELAIKGFRLGTEDQSQVEHDHPVGPIPDAFSPPNQGQWQPPIFDTLLQMVIPTAFAHRTSSGFSHSSYFVLIDRQGNIRGYYQSVDRKAMTQLKEDIHFLLDTKR